VLETAVPLPSGRPPGRSVRLTVSGTDPRGVAVSRSLAGACAVVFLSTTCDGCRDLAELVREGTDGASVLGVLRGPQGGLPSPEVTAFTGETGEWLLGDDPFEALDVRSAPFFCIVVDGVVLVEGVAFGRSHLEVHLRRVQAGAPLPDSVRLDPS
jgi:hypothetical protein